MNHHAVTAALALVSACLAEESTPPDTRVWLPAQPTVRELGQDRWQVEFRLTQAECIKARADCFIDLADRESRAKDTCRITALGDTSRVWEYSYERESGGRILRSQVSRGRREMYRKEVTSALRRLWIEDGAIGSDVIERKLTELHYICNKAGLEQYLHDVFNRRFRFVYVEHRWELRPDEPDMWFSACQIATKLAEWLTWTELVGGMKAA